jgi:hypothetical protein
MKQSLGKQGGRSFIEILKGLSCTTPSPLDKTKFRIDTSGVHGLVVTLSQSKEAPPNSTEV